MSKNLVIVESPAKAKTIEKFLGKDFKVVSSNGHIADLPSKELGINIDNNYEPKYIVNSDKKDIVRKLKKESKSAEMVWLASDEDREGEAIAWHLYELLGLNKSNAKRIVFREITKNAVLNSIQNPREINESLVNPDDIMKEIKVNILKKLENSFAVVLNKNDKKYSYKELKKRIQNRL